METFTAKDARILQCSTDTLPYEIARINTDIKNAAIDRMSEVRVLRKLSAMVIVHLTDCGFEINHCTLNENETIISW